MPVQRSARGIARMQAILRAAVTVFARDGVDRATTNAIAAEAGISPGSLYQYFDDRIDILRAVTRDYATRLSAVYELVLPEFTPRTPRRELVSGLLRPLAEFKRANAAFIIIYAHPSLPEELRSEVDAVNANFDAWLMRLLSARNPKRTRNELRVASRQASMLFRGMLPLLGEVTGDEDRDLDELCDVVDSYLASRGIA